MAWNRILQSGDEKLVNILKVLPEESRAMRDCGIFCCDRGNSIHLLIEEDGNWRPFHRMVVLKRG